MEIYRVYDRESYLHISTSKGMVSYQLITGKIFDCFCREIPFKEREEIRKVVKEAGYEINRK